MSWQKHLASIIEQEPELWLDYLTGKRLAGDLPMLKTKRFAPPTFGLKALWFAVWALGKWSFRAEFSPTTHAKSSFVVLATSRNQINTTSGTIEALRAEGNSVLGISKKKRLKATDEKRLYDPIAYNAKDIIRALIAFRNHGRTLDNQLKEKCVKGARSYFLEIAKVYLYLAYFYRILGETNPKYVVTSNDHSALNRCMLAIAHHLDIKTVYIQHASVSPAFPALLFDYAFLDGPAAAETYARCSDNRPDTLKRCVKPNIIYSGQKKSLTRQSEKTKHNVGIAVNKLDDMDSVIEVIQSLINQSVKVITRWHPRQSMSDIRKLEKQASYSVNLTLSNPEHETVDDFLSSLDWLVAGNSSIHLEGAIKGVAPIYYEFSPAEISDYYGYAKKGLAKWVKSENELLAILTSGAPPELNRNAVRFYSSTFGTEWEGRESELVAKHLSSQPLANDQTD
ncbi:MAG: hypothetical protein KA296_02310 [Marinobacter sp.]|nr:hypothetical protein [Marinobacter sp.]